MNTLQIRTIIAETRARDAGRLEALVRDRMGTASEADVAEAVRYAQEYIEAVPFLMEQVSRAADARGAAFTVRPLLEHAEQYFLDPADHLPETTYGLVGLLDDAYLALSLIQIILEAPDPLLDLDLDGPNAFAQALLGPDFTARLDAEVRHARQRMVQQVFKTMAELREQALEPPAAPATPAERLDERLVGKWLHSTRMASNGLTISRHRYRVYAPDGRFVEFSQSLSDTADEEAWSSLYPGLQPAHRGQWEVHDGHLSLSWDDAARADFAFELAGSRLVLEPHEGEAQLWQRS